MINIFYITIIILLIPLAIAGLSLAPWVPANRKDFPRINEQLQLKKGSVFYELGCGEGRLSRYIAKQNPEAKVVGVEIMVTMYLLAQLRQLLHPHKNLRYIYGDALKTDLRNADALYTYALIKTINAKLKPKFLKELKPGCRIVSYHFAMQDWPGKSLIEQPTKTDVPLHVYQVI